MRARPPGRANEVQRGRIRPQHHPGSTAHLRPVDATPTCPSAQSSPVRQPGAGSYGAATQMCNYAWKTEHSSAGTSRTFSITLNDGSSHQAMFGYTPRSHIRPFARQRGVVNGCESQPRERRKTADSVRRVAAQPHARLRIAAISGGIFAALDVAPGAR